MMMMMRMLSCKGRQWGVCDNDDGKEEVVEVGNNAGGRQKGGFEEPSRKTARPTAPTGPTRVVRTKWTKTHCPSPPATVSKWRQPKRSLGFERTLTFLISIIFLLVVNLLLQSQIFSS